MKPFSAISLTLAIVIGVVVAHAQRGPAQSPASQRPPQTVTPQTYPDDLAQAGQARFAAQCALCHARDTFGSDSGPDLSRSGLVAEDVRGDKIGPLVKAGRVNKGMPAFDLSDADIAAIVAYIHTQKAVMITQGGGRRNVDAAQLQSGDSAAGQRYFNANCAQCHSAAGDLKGVATRFTGLPLLQRMLYPSGRGGAATGENPLNAHFDQLGKYTDADMHNVLAYLQTLK